MELMFCLKWLKAVIIMKRNTNNHHHHKLRIWTLFTQ